MEPIIMMVLIVVVLYVLLRVRATYRRARKYDRTDEIQARLTELRKKRDEE